ncbi:energy-coupling factor transporter transmembrane component T family protein [Vagococcus vulneris]|uniref:Cobalt ABC transporter permease n=1 Tax=Vagococcus vulneris TaxID=1977869 RepID=A0A429ZZP1_9ENTE|nr:energy-coupling factor transporter transmembrane component T [Vagococcus vulneris]RST99487.1 hypothetical protein CBF37_03955 [Vagococcus vulneris]
MKKQVMLAFDPRSKLVTIIVAGLLLMFRVDWQVEISFVIYLSVLLYLNNQFKKAIVLLMTYVILLVLNQFVVTTINGPITAFLSFLLIAYQLLLPPVMASIFAASNTSINQWSAALKKCHVPNFIVIPFIVVCRFFPTFLEDMKQIRQAMKFRGIGLTRFGLIRHPIQTFEYIFVPLLMSIEKTSLDVSAAAIIRGLGSGHRQTSIQPVSWQLQDTGLVIGTVLFLIVGVVI